MWIYLYVAICLYVASLFARSNRARQFGAPCVVSIFYLCTGYITSTLESAHAVQLPHFAALLFVRRWEAATAGHTTHLRPLAAVRALEACTAKATRSRGESSAIEPMTVLHAPSYALKYGAATLARTATISPTASRYADTLGLSSTGRCIGVPAARTSSHSARKLAGTVLGTLPKDEILNHGTSLRAARFANSTRA